MPATSSTALWYTTRATGVVALVLLTGTMVLGILTAGRAKSRAWPAFVQAELHKRVSLLAMVFLAFHVLTSVLDTYVHLGWLSIVVPFSSSYKPLWTGLGAVAVDLMLAVAISSALRQRIDPRTWRAIHWVAYGSWPVALAHALGEGTDASKLWMDALAAACTLAVVGALTWRLSTHRQAQELAARVGATTRAVSPRGGPGRERTAAPRTTPRSSADRSSGDRSGRTVPARSTAPTTRVLERDRP